MTLTVLIRGEKEDKKFFDQNKTTLKDAYPAVVDDGQSMGVGLLQDYGLEPHGQYWALAAPKLLITSFRGMKIAQELKEFQNNILCYCWYGGNRKVHPADQHYVDSIEAKIGRKKREEILEMVPENLDQVLSLIKEKNIDFDTSELEEEIKEDRIKPTSLINRAIEDYNKSLEEYRKKEHKKSSLLKHLHL